MTGVYFNLGKKHKGHPGAAAGEACSGLASQQEHLT